jgi:hypothetical protein
MDGPPYRMEVQQTQGKGTVEFRQEDTGIVTARHPVKLPVDGTWIIDLRTDVIPVPGCTVEFFDSAPLPGRFRIRIGETKFDVMEAYYRVDGKPLQWIRSPRPGG